MGTASVMAYYPRTSQPYCTHPNIHSPPIISFYPAGALGCSGDTVHRLFASHTRYADFVCIVSDMRPGPNGTMDALKKKDAMIDFA